MGLLLLALLRPPLQPGGTGERPQPIRRRDQVMPIEQVLSAAEQKSELHDRWLVLAELAPGGGVMEANKIEPNQMVKVVNNIVGYDFEVDPDYPEPQLRPDGTRHQI